MPTVTDEAVCIRHWDFSETSQTVSLFTREHGLLRGLAKGARREKGRFTGGIDLLARGQVVAIVKPGRELATLTDWDLTDAHWPLRQSLEAGKVAFYLADLIGRMITDHDPHPAAFDSFVRALTTLHDPDEIQAALLSMQWDLLRETGYKPRLNEDAETGSALPSDATTHAFSAGAGGVVADTGHGDRWRVRRQTIELLRTLESDESQVAAVPKTMRRANLLLAAYIRELLGVELMTFRWAFPELINRG